MIFRCSFFIFLIIVWFVFLFLEKWKDGFFWVSLISLIDILFIFVLVFGLMVILIIGLGKFICFNIIGLLELYRVFLVMVFFRFVGKSGRLVKRVLR